MRISLLCPGLVDTNMGETARVSGVDDPATWFGGLPRGYESIAPERVGEMVCDAIRDERYLVLTHPELMEPVLEARGRDVAAAIEEQRTLISPSPNLHRET